MRIQVEPVRPRVATVVAVVWLYLGTSWLVLSGLMLLGGLQFVRLASGQFAWLGALPAFFGGIFIAAALGLAGALKLLQLRSRGRVWLELANWIACGVVLLFTLSACHELGSVPYYFGMKRFDPSRAWLPFLVGVLCSLPFAVMARKLRNPELLFAIRDVELRRGDQ